MSRIYLTRHKKDNYWIHDILDGKKLGKIKVKNEKHTYKINHKYKGKLLETESLLLLDTTIEQTFNEIYKNLIQQYCLGWKDLSDYDFPFYIESCRLKQCEDDMFSRKTWLHPAARKAWRKMKAAAQSVKIDLQIISAFRTLNYQKQLIENKIQKGQKIENILKVNTLPGFSEHHTGCAIDIGSSNAAVLEPEFDQSPAYQWLVNNAHHYNFYLTYPKDNTTGIMYEPWHWCFKK